MVHYCDIYVVIFQFLWYESSVDTIFGRSPIVGGVVADRILGYKKAVIYGAVLMSIGHIILGFGGDSKLYLGMAFIVCGYGLF